MSYFRKDMFFLILILTSLGLFHTSLREVDKIYFPIGITDQLFTLGYVSVIICYIHFFFWVKCGFFPEMTQHQHIQLLQKNTRAVSTSGGFIFILVPIFLHVIFINQWNMESVILFTVIILGLLYGFYDDCCTMIYRNGSRHNAMAYACLSLPAIIYNMAVGRTEILLPILPKISYGIFYFPIMFPLVFTNLVGLNITDGFNGGLALPVILILIALLCCYFLCFNFITLRIFLFWGSAIFSLFFLVCVSLLVFLIFNLTNRIYMGNSGSVALSVLLTQGLVLLKMEFASSILLLLFTLQTLSVGLQRLWYRYKGVLLLPMTPIHHSFQVHKYSNTSILLIFSSFTALCIGFFILFVWFYYIRT